MKVIEVLWSAAILISSIMYSYLWSWQKRTVRKKYNKLNHRHYWLPSVFFNENDTYLFIHILTQFLIYLPQICLTYWIPQYMRIFKAQYSLVSPLTYCNNLKIFEKLLFLDLVYIKLIEGGGLIEWLRVGRTRNLRIASHMGSNPVRDKPLLFPWARNFTLIAQY